MGKYKQFDDAVFKSSRKGIIFQIYKSMQVVSIVAQNMKTCYVPHLKKNILSNIWSFFLKSLDIASLQLI